MANLIQSALSKIKGVYDRVQQSSYGQFANQAQRSLQAVSPINAVSQFARIPEINTQTTGGKFLQGTVGPASTLLRGYGQSAQVIQQPQKYPTFSLTQPSKVGAALDVASLAPAATIPMTLGLFRKTGLRDILKADDTRIIDTFIDSVSQGKKFEPMGQLGKDIQNIVEQPLVRRTLTRIMGTDPRLVTNQKLASGLQKFMTAYDQPSIGMSTRAIGDIKEAEKATAKSPLATEATKYKSAEEFKVYRGGELNLKEMTPERLKGIAEAYPERSQMGWGAYFTTDKNYASAFNKNVQELNLPKNIKYFDLIENKPLSVSEFNKIKKIAEEGLYEGEKFIPESKKPLDVFEKLKEHFGSEVSGVLKDSGYGGLRYEEFNPSYLSGEIGRKFGKQGEDYLIFEPQKYSGIIQSGGKQLGHMATRLARTDSIATIGIGAKPITASKPLYTQAKGATGKVKIPTVTMEKGKVRLRAKVQPTMLDEERLPANLKEALTPSKPISETVGGGGQSGIPGQISSPPSVSDSDLISQMTKAIKEAKPLRGMQEQLYTKARGQKFARLMSARARVPGEKGYFAELGALKGELPKVEYESIRQQFSQENVDRLFDMVRQNNSLDDWDKIGAESGLAKILGKEGGGVPTRGEIEQLYQVFGKEFTETLLAKRPILEKITGALMQAYNLPRSIMAGAGDLSATLMQNLMFAYRHPIMTAKNFTKELKMFASEDFYKLSQQEIYQRPNYKLMKEAKLSFTDVGPVATGREEAFMSAWAEKIPGLGRLIKASGRAYTGFLNRMRADVFDQLVEAQKSLGGAVNDTKFLRDAGSFVNAGTGRGSLGPLEKSANVLAQGFFSARKLAATAKFLDPRTYITASPVVRKEALKTVSAFLVGGTLITNLAKLSGAEVGDDPTSADYGKIKIGNTRFNVWGPYQQIAVLFARLWKGYGTSSTTGKKFQLKGGEFNVSRLDLISRFFESKEHPTLSLIISALRGENAIGEPFDLPVEVLNRFIPMVLGDGYDLYKEHGPIGLLGTIPTILGIPAQTYGKQIPTMGTTPMGKPKVELKPVGGIGEDVIRRLRGEPVSNIPESQWPGILRAKEMENKADIIKQQQKELVESKVKEKTQKPGLLDKLNLFKNPVEEEKKKQGFVKEAHATEEMNDYEKKAMVELFKLSEEKTTTIGNKFYYKDGDSTKSIDLGWKEPELPKVSGTDAFSKAQIESYKSDISARQKDIMKLLDLKEMSYQQAYDEYLRLDTLKKTATNKVSVGKKIKIKKVSLPKPKKLKLSAKIKRVKLREKPMKKVKFRSKL